MATVRILPENLPILLSAIVALSLIGQSISANLAQMIVLNPALLVRNLRANCRSSDAN